MNRENDIARLKKQPLDLLVIGGGATGAGIALDAASRGLATGLVEREDFAAGTSSRSTKLVHGGVRYLEQAVKKLDRGQLKLVRDALHERTTLHRIAPHLVHPLAILTPLYSRLDVPYYRTGLSVYDKLAGKSEFPASHFVKPDEALERFPMLIPDGLRGAVIYYDGQFDDARMNVSIAITAHEQGAAVANYVEAVALKKSPAGKINGARLRDRLTNEEWDIDAKVVINATGPFGDAVRKLDDPKATPMLKASSGVHIVLDRKFSPPDTGLLIPKTEDNRVLFLLPWLGHTLVGTTDNPAEIERDPKAKEEEIAYILRQLKKYFALDVGADKILASWSGLRPLVADPKAADTARLSRDHIVNVSPSGLVTIAGGKWTTYRKMALDAVDQAVAVAGLKPPRPSGTEEISVAGGDNWQPAGDRDLAKRHDLAADIASHLHHAYGSRADSVVKGGSKKRLVEGHPYIEAEVTHAVKHESARSAGDVLARRMRLAFLDAKATERARPRVEQLIAAATK